MKVTDGTADVTERFSPGSYVTLTDAEALNRPPFDVLACGRVLSLADPALSEGQIDDARQVKQIVIIGQVCVPDRTTDCRVGRPRRRRRPWSRPRQDRRR